MWQVYDRQAASGSEFCKIALLETAEGQRLTLAVQGCAAPLGGATTWTIESSQLALYDGKGQPIAKLGGSQNRVTGSSASGVSIILERPGGDGTAAALRDAANASGCIFAGYTQKCATKAETALPVLPANGGGKIKLLVDLSVRIEPRGDADIVGAVKAGECIAVDTCNVASDGPWCRATFGQTAGWLRKYTLRQNRWPVVVFANAC